MKYSEATKLIKGLSKKYSINNSYSDYFQLSYKSSPIAWVNKQEQFHFDRVTASTSEFDKLPYSHKLWMILAELAMTPLSERSTPNKWNVIVAIDNSILAPFIVWKKKKYYPYGLELEAVSHPSELDEAIFDDYEYKDLIKYIKTLPDGQWQSKVAEHGKTEVKGD